MPFHRSSPRGLLAPPPPAKRESSLAKMPVHSGAVATKSAGKIAQRSPVLVPPVQSGQIGGDHPGCGIPPSDQDDFAFGRIHVAEYVGYNDNSQACWIDVSAVITPWWGYALMLAMMSRNEPPGKEFYATGVRLRAVRDALGLSREDLAKFVGNVGWEAIRDWELGASPPGIRQMLVLAERFDIGLDYIYRGKIHVLPDNLRADILKNERDILENGPRKPGRPAAGAKAAK